MRAQLRRGMAPGNRRRLPLPLTITHKPLLCSGSDGKFRKFVHGLLAFTARLQAIRNGLGALIHLSGTQYTILISIAHLEQDGEVNVGMIAEHLHISDAFVTIETGRLAKKGLVTKQASNHDKRRVRLQVTAEGRRLLAELAPTQSRANDLLFGALNERDFERIQELLPALIEGGEAAHALLAYERSRQYRKARRIMTNASM